MCGIVGQVRSDGAPVDRRMIECMCRALEHRGPDSRGVHTSQGVGLGIQRLRIIDLAGGDQPIYNEDRSVAVVLNGEIYNFQRLREDLRRRGHVFTTSSDTEVIVHLYEEEGPDCVRSLQGMFAVAVWDMERHELLLARDRVGKKPLYYSFRDGVLSFASEINALMQDPEIPRDLDYQALDCYLAYQYVPSPLSAFRAVRKLPPATTMVLREGAITTSRYWRLDYARKRRGATVGELQEELRTKLRKAVSRRMVSDVPIGAFLSGGIDSSAVVAAMAETSSRVKTFSIGFDDSAFNELEHARTIARLFDTDHHEFIVTPDAVAMIPRIVRQYGEPFADSSAIPSFYLAKHTREHVTVALNGDGGDESFAGYNRYSRMLAEQRLARLPGPARHLMGRLGERVPVSSRGKSGLSRTKRLLRVMALDTPARYARHMSYFDTQQRAELYTDEFSEMIGESLAPSVIANAWHAASGESRVDAMLEVDVETYLPGDLLVKMDIATMAYSLEARSPLLDPELMEFAAAIPSDLKLTGPKKKILLREALRDWIPDGVLDRPKMGFGVPLGRWFREDLHDYVRDILLDRQTLGRGYFEEPYVRGLVDRHQAGLEEGSARIWALLMLELWHREFIDVPLPSADLTE